MGALNEFCVTCCGGFCCFILGVVSVTMVVLPTVSLGNITLELATISMNGLDQVTKDWNTPFIVDVYAVDSSQTCESAIYDAQGEFSLQKGTSIHLIEYPW